MEQPEAKTKITDADVARKQNEEENATEKQPQDNTVPSKPAEPEHEYITGFKLWIVIASITLCCFLMMLDTSIIVTVSFTIKACESTSA